MGRSFVKNPLLAALVVWQKNELVLGALVQNENAPEAIKPQALLETSSVSESSKDDREEDIEQTHPPITKYIGWSGAPFDHSHHDFHHFDATHHMPDYLHDYGHYDHHDHYGYHTPHHALAHSAAGVEHGWGRFRHVLSDWSGRTGHDMNNLGHGLEHMGGDLSHLGDAVDDHDHYGFHDDSYHGYSDYGHRFYHGGHSGFHGHDWGHSPEWGHFPDWGHHSEGGYQPQWDHYPEWSHGGYSSHVPSGVVVSALQTPTTPGWQVKPTTASKP